MASRSLLLLINLQISLLAVESYKYLRAFPSSRYVELVWTRSLCGPWRSMFDSIPGPVVRSDASVEGIKKKIKILKLLCFYFQKSRVNSVLWSHCTHVYLTSEYRWNSVKGFVNQPKNLNINLKINGSRRSSDGFMRALSCSFSLVWFQTPVVGPCQFFICQSAELGLSRFFTTFKDLQNKFSHYEVKHETQYCFFFWFFLEKRY